MPTSSFGSGRFSASREGGRIMTKAPIMTISPVPGVPTNRTGRTLAKDTPNWLDSCEHGQGPMLNKPSRACLRVSSRKPRPTALGRTGARPLEVLESVQDWAQSCSKIPSDDLQHQPSDRWNIALPRRAKPAEQVDIVAFQPVDLGTYF